MADKLGVHLASGTDLNIVEEFAICIGAILRVAHGTNCCSHHQAVLAPIAQRGTIITFNYDLVVERALRPHVPKDFGPWLYGFDKSGNSDVVLLKLHGSSNWKSDGEKFVVRHKSWSEFEDNPGYRGHEGEGDAFPILLPFWEKPIEKKPWLPLWQTAHDRLFDATDVLVWGYSLPPTDIKAQHLFTLSLGRKSSFRLCVIDPAENARQRWREMFPNALFWEYSAIDEFLLHPPHWWGLQGG